MLEQDKNPNSEGSGTMLFQLLKSLLMILPQSTCYNILKDRLASISRFRQGATPRIARADASRSMSGATELFVTRIEQVRSLHCSATWVNIRADSLEVPHLEHEIMINDGADRRGWLGYATKQEETEALLKFRQEKNTPRQSNFVKEEVKEGYHDLEAVGESVEKVKDFTPNEETKEEMGADGWKHYWANADPP
jgi:hypothetical protein